MEDDEATLVGPHRGHRGAGANRDESTSTPKIAFDFWATQINDDSSSDGTSQLQVSTTGPDQPMPDFPDQGHKLEVSIPALPWETRQQYQETHSDVVEKVWAVDKSPSDEGELVEVEFSDGTLRKVSSSASCSFIFYHLVHRPFIFVTTIISAFSIPDHPSLCQRYFTSRSLWLHFMCADCFCYCFEWYSWVSQLLRDEISSCTSLGARFVHFTLHTSIWMAIYDSIISSH